MSESIFSIQAHRISRKSDFTMLYTQGKRCNYKNLKVRHLKSDGDSLGCAFVISRKVGNAIFRNKLRRIMRDFIFQNQDSIENNAMILIQYFPKDRKLFNKTELRQDICKLLTKAGLLT